MGIILRNYNSYYDGNHILVKSRFELSFEDKSREPLSLIKNQYIQHHMFIRADDQQNDIPMFIYEMLEERDIKLYHTNEELFSFLNEFFLVTWDCFDAYTKEYNQNLLDNILYPQLKLSKECYVINADEISKEKKNDFGDMVYDYYLMLMWKDSQESLYTAIIFSD